MRFSRCFFYHLVCCIAVLVAIAACVFIGICIGVIGTLTLALWLPVLIGVSAGLVVVFFLLILIMWCINRHCQR